MMTKKGSTKIVNFMESVAGVLMIGTGHIRRHNDFGLSSTLSMCNTWVAIVLREYTVAFLCYS